MKPTNPDEPNPALIVNIEPPPTGKAGREAETAKEHLILQYGIDVLRDLENLAFLRSATRESMRGTERMAKQVNGQLRAYQADLAAIDLLEKEAKGEA